jgi:hypothetical protein
MAPVRPPVWVDDLPALFAAKVRTALLPKGKILKLQLPKICQKPKIAHPRVTRVGPNFEYETKH